MIHKIKSLYDDGNGCSIYIIVKDDPDNNKFIECAVALDSKIIISGDKHLKNIKKYIDIHIISPKEFNDKHC